MHAGRPTLPKNGGAGGKLVDESGAPIENHIWLSPAEGSFRTTFYSTGKAEEALMSSAISNSLKEGLRSRSRQRVRP
jgi:hypothetical protein